MTKPIVRNPEHVARKRPAVRHKPARNIAITKTLAAKRRGELPADAVPSHELPRRKVFDDAWRAKNPNYMKLYRARLGTDMLGTNNDFINQCRQEFRKGRLPGQGFVDFVRMKLIARLGLPV
jgi:hypothetical protein